MGAPGSRSARTEYVFGRGRLLLKRGKPVFVRGTILRCSKRLAASIRRKPEEFYPLVEATRSGSRVDLFARPAASELAIARKRNHAVRQAGLRIGDSRMRPLLPNIAPNRPRPTVDTRILFQKRNK